MSERSISPFEKFGSAFPLTDAAIQIHVFSATDTISSIAQKYYSDWSLWRLIAERNAIADVRKIETGTQLIIPHRPLEIGRYESL